MNLKSRKINEIATKCKTAKKDKFQRRWVAWIL